MLSPQNFTQSLWERDHITDFLSMSRPYTCGAVTEIDITDTLERISECERELKMAISLHGVIIYYFAQAAIQHPLTLTYRYRNKLVTFQDADIATSILRKQPDGQRCLTSYIIRVAQNKSMAQIQWELRKAMREPMTEMPVNFGFFQHFYKRFLCWRMLRNPFLFKARMGNLGITNLQSPGLKIPFNIFGLNPYTLGLAIGTVTNHVRMNQQGVPIERKILSLSGLMDHAIIDGYPVSQFSVTMSNFLSSSTGLDADFIKEMRNLKAGKIHE